RAPFLQPHAADFGFRRKAEIEQFQRLQRGFDQHGSIVKRRLIRLAPWRGHDHTALFFQRDSWMGGHNFYGPFDLACGIFQIGAERQNGAGHQIWSRVLTISIAASPATIGSGASGLRTLMRTQSSRSKRLKSLTIMWCPSASISLKRFSSKASFTRS